MFNTVGLVINRKRPDRVRQEQGRQPYGGRRKSLAGNARICPFINFRPLGIRPSDNDSRSDRNATG